MLALESSSPQETERIGATVATRLAAGDVVAVAGELGSGKTTFVRGACRALGVSSPVTSPTYAIGNRYVGRIPVSHLDLYRLDEVDDPEWGNLESYFDGAVVLVEWPERAGAYLPPSRVTVRLRHLKGDHRLVEVESDDKALEAAVSGSC